MRGKAKIKTTQFLKTSLILVLTLSLSIFTFLALFMSHQSASTIREISQMYMSSMGDQIAMHFETTIGLRLDQLVSMVQTVLPADAHASPSQEQELITNALDPVQNVTRRHIIGGPSPERVQETIDNGQMQVEQLKTWRLAEEARLLAVEDALVAAAEAVVQAN